MNAYTTILDAVKKFDYEKAAALLEANIREENARNAGKKAVSRLKIISNMMKSADSYNTGFKKAHNFGDINLFTDGYRIFTSDSDFGFDHAEPHELFKLNDMIKNVMRDVSDKIILNREEIQLYIKLERFTRARYERTKPFYLKSENGNIYAFNPFYLLDFIDFTGDDTALAISPKNPIIDENGSALVLPVNHGFNIEAFNSWRDRYFGSDTALKTA